MNPNSSATRFLSAILILLALCVSQPVFAREENSNPSPVTRLPGNLLPAIQAPPDSKSPENRRPVRIVYFSPSDCEPFAGREERLGRVMRGVQVTFEYWMMKSCGEFTFLLEWQDPETKKKLKLHEVRGAKKQCEYGRNDAHVVREEVKKALAEEGINIDQEFVVIFEQLLKWEGSKAIELGPYCGGGSPFAGTAWVFDDPLLNWDLLSSKEPGGWYYGPCSLGQFNSHYVGGIAHEMGHMFGLPHACQHDEDLPKWGHSLMGSGNHTFGEQFRGEGAGTFLCAASALRLRKNVAFAGDDVRPNRRNGSFWFSALKARWQDGQIVLSGKIIQTELKGATEMNPRVECLIAYHDKKNPEADYDAKTWVSYVKPDGRFEIRITEWERTDYQLRLVGVHENGTTSQLAIDYRIQDASDADLEPINVITKSNKKRK